MKSCGPTISIWLSCSWSMKVFTEPYPEEWTWEGWLDLQRVKYVEKAVICFRSRLGSAESLAKMHTESFADRMLALANGDDDGMA